MTRWIVLVVAACGHQGMGASPAVAPPADPGKARDAEIAARAAPFVDAFSNYSAVLAPDGQVVFVSTRDGLPQLYASMVGEPDQPPRRLPGPPERMLAPRLLPDGRTLVFLSDVGSDRKYHVFRIGLDGSGLVDLTPDGELRRTMPRIARWSGTMVYGAHVLGDQTTRVFVQTLDEPPREIHRDPKVGFVADVSADGRRALYVQQWSVTEEVLFALDVATGAPARLFPPDGQRCALGGAAFTADGASAITACAARGQPLRVVKLDAATGAEQAHYCEAGAPTARLGGLAVSPAGDRVVIGLEAGEHSELRMLDAHDLRALEAPRVPLADIDVGEFDGDGRRLMLTVRLPDAPPEIAALDVATGEIEPLRREPRPGLAPPPRTTIERLPAFDGGSIPVNVYLPDGKTGRLPTLVLIHGGPYGTAKIAWNPTVAFWTAMGFAVIAPNIRGSSGYGIEYEEADDRERRIGAVRDVESVNRWARAQPWCDGDKLVIGGLSYGGYMTLLALTRQPALWRAGIDGSGMSNLRTMEQLEDQTIRAFDDTEFGVLGKDDALLVEWSPITAVDRIVAPVFVYQGARDPVTPQYEADQIVAALRRRAVPVEYMLVANEGHGVTRRENLIAYLARSYRFVAEHLGLR
ncbi:MAG TPA: prolyl oligopeptidase family serine peptidase [Kofleriaceae bacterium]|jgi:dipeptidyl aminopeptidase/acylaminoacyl peptidase|nr:prolyl oligopeptidase family serine peptidase [Kofleriaceae bacterium]